MRLAYIITAYKQPEQFKRLLDALWHPDDAFAVHVDAKTPTTVRVAFQAAAAGRENVHFVDPIPVAWGGFGLCEAEWRCLTWLVTQGEWDYLANITVQDFPLKRRDEMLAELARHPGANYMDIRRIDELPPHFARRSRWLCWETPKKVRRLPIPNLPPRGFRNAYYGIGFHVLSRAFCTWLTETPLMEECRRYFRRTWHPHEHWLQAMIMASPFRDTVVLDNKRHINWGGGSGHPKLLTMANLPELETSTAFFGRKFDMAIDAEVISALEKRLRLRAAA
ncbi:beta-1,6-N-acetylglucosaminyltransferase [Arenibaculum pallidiluteum]|uniref:beta-1,6-N-acetylglucosaminyltransferase n=1 Tax=Arenibaculum pallidiluteum TaxID=2812559 RepID=UPI001A9798F8|nr:beta-1,6-N-acetylglucosaminyltransferase [Arenibaculum pallidiluteum]